MKVKFIRPAMMRGKHIEPGTVMEVPTLADVANLGDFVEPYIEEQEAPAEVPAEKGKKGKKAPVETSVPDGSEADAPSEEVPAGEETETNNEGV